MLWLPLEATQGADFEPGPILVAEDNLLNQRMMMLMLRHLKLECEIVGNGRETVDSLARKDYGLILMDIEMPVMDGLEATRQIRANKSSRFRQPRIVAVTASRVGEEACRKAGMDGLITKPLEINRLRYVMQRLRYLPTPPGTEGMRSSIRWFGSSPSQ